VKWNICGCPKDFRLLILQIGALCCALLWGRTCDTYIGGNTSFCDSFSRKTQVVGKWGGKISTMHWEETRAFHMLTICMNKGGNGSWTL